MQIDKLQLLILSIMEGTNATTPGTGMTLHEIAYEVNKSDDYKYSQTTVNRKVWALRELEYVTSKMKTNNGDLILPYCDYDSNPVEERNINISKCEIDRDFQEYNVIENIIWCIENLQVTEIEDYEYDVIGCDLDTIQFSVPIELLIKMIRPDAVSTVYIDKIVDFEHDEYLTDVKDMNVFAE